MTHEELLTEIDRLEKVLTDSYGISALRAVVQLHKPFSTRGFEGDPKCIECSGLDSNDWPCLTIQAIQKKLQ